MLLKRLSLKQLLTKIDRACAWSLVVFLVIYFLTGYGMTRGFVSPELSKLIHNSILPVPFAASFGFHSAFGAHVALKRWRIWSPTWPVVLAVYVMVLVAGVVMSQFVLGATGAGEPLPVRIEL